MIDYSALRVFPIKLLELEDDPFSMWLHFHTIFLNNCRLQVMQAIFIKEGEMNRYYTDLISHSLASQFLQQTPTSMAFAQIFDPM